MLVLFGDSLFSGFATTRHIPAQVRSEKTVLSDEPLTSVAQVIKESIPSTEVCALPGHAPHQVRQWFDLTPQWRDRPTIFWFGRCLKPIEPEEIVYTHIVLAQQMRAPWWICAVPGSGREERKGTLGRVIAINDGLRLFAKDAFLNPIEEMGGQVVFPEERRMDHVHPNCETNRAIANWLIERTIGALARSAA
jgi:hypothetical protein